MVTFFMRLIAMIVSFLLLSATFVSADVYKYIDENGVVCYTDAPLQRRAERVLADKKTRPAMPAPQSRRNAARGVDYSAYVHNAASKYEIAPELIHAVIKTESNGNQMAVSRKGAMGLMQLMPSTANDMNVVNPFDPEENIEGGTRYLRALLEKFNGDLTLALAAYNAGPGTVEKYGCVPPIAETKEYVKRVYSLYKGGKSVGALSNKESLPNPVTVYKVVLEDGTVLFTNSPLTKAEKTRF